MRISWSYVLALIAFLFIPADSTETKPYADFIHVRIDGKPLHDILNSVLDTWDFKLPESGLRKGTGYIGANFRARRVVRDMLSGKRPVKIAVIGGTVSAAQHGVSKRGETDWVSLIGSWISKAFKGHNITVANHAVAGSTSAKTAPCVVSMLDPEVDMVFSEFVYDDGFESQILQNSRTRGYELLIRQLLMLPGRPAVIMMQTMVPGAAAEDKHPGKKAFHITQEDVYGALSQYYDVQWLSFRDATYRLAQHRPTPGLGYQDLMDPSPLHSLPSDAGHKVLADLAVWFMQQTAVDLALRPYDHTDVEQSSEPVPPSMFPKNTLHESVTCS
ncbi:hypothetical protein CEUSTIGMA_g2118.t1 [Chlamydomonas eustigma]|uniref:SGNH hydrolase-type esterase domain-containing protein n=1 Tax=Chlamydomonas eustigma TaxID=1157962 RepID=A0A250WVW2_9CHLO|nr:hypothetical protein CEUSTIGMA_g2118.t1 [Chlamydomonas eustigma]|eukprot:GAX74670.1 hypothetical protein CEUSTIGMA_g2118.t1 [Chlamydomonas eustigma]